MRKSLHSADAQVYIPSSCCDHSWAAHCHRSLGRGLAVGNTGDGVPARHCAPLDLCAGDSNHVADRS